MWPSPHSAGPPVWTDRPTSAGRTRSRVREAGPHGTSRLPAPHARWRRRLALHEFSISPSNSMMRRSRSSKKSTRPTSLPCWSRISTWGVGWKPMALSNRRVRDSPTDSDPASASRTACRAWVTSRCPESLLSQVWRSSAVVLPLARAASAATTPVSMPQVIAAPRMARAGVTQGVRPIRRPAPGAYAVWMESPR
jgi:hypothetical protein